MNADYELDLSFPAPVEKLFAAVATEEGVRGWWTKFAEMDARIGGRFHASFPPAEFYATFTIAELTPPSLILWECTDSRHPKSMGFQNLQDWIGTRIQFRCEPEGEGSKLHFTHIGLGPLGCAEVCSDAWRFYLASSLRQFLEKGEGLSWDGSPKSDG